MWGGNLISLNPKTLSRVEKRGEDCPACPLPRQWSPAHGRGAKGGCACAGDRQTRTRRRTRHVGRDTDRPALGQTPLLGGTEPRDYAGGRKHVALVRANSAWALLLPSPSTVPPPRAGETDRQTHRHIEGRRHRAEACDLLMGPGRRVKACFRGTENGHGFCKWGAGEELGRREAGRGEGERARDSPLPAGDPIQPWPKSPEAEQRPRGKLEVLATRLL